MELAGCATDNKGEARSEWVQSVKKIINKS
jgi:hypothetical protein